MVTNKKLKELTWKYFWKQKAFEIGITIGILFCIFWLPFLVGYTSCQLNQSLTESWSTIHNSVEANSYHPKCFSDLTTTYIMGWMMILLLMIIFCVIGLIIFLICKWIYNNWKKAKQRAREEIKNGNKQRG